jgi:hypothetical protein
MCTKQSYPEPNPTIMSYSASAVKKLTNATSSLVRFENKNILFFFEKRSCLLCKTLAL